MVTCFSQRRFLGVALAFTLAASLPLAAAVAKPFAPAKLKEIDAFVLAVISSNGTPGAVVWIEHQGQIFTNVYGRAAVVPAPEPAALDTIYDVASLTKVLATTPSLLLLIERGKVELDKPVATYLPKFTGDGREKITVRHLMTHFSGLPSGLTRRDRIEDYDSGIAQALVERPTSTPGTAFRYSDVNFLLAGEIVRVVSGRSLAEFARAEVFEPLGMVDTSYLPPKDKLPRIAPTEQVGGNVLRGVVHDPTARRMGGIAGHAGVFSTAADVARYCRMLLNGGELEGKRIFKAETVKLMTTVQSPAVTRRGLGWDIDSPYAGPRGKVLPIGSYGHTGWTGPSIWIDPFSQTFVLLMCNRNHPKDGNVLPLRSRLGTLAAEAITDFDFRNVPGALPPAPKQD